MAFSTGMQIRSALVKKYFSASSAFSTNTLSRVSIVSANWSCSASTVTHTRRCCSSSVKAVFRKSLFSHVRSVQFSQVTPQPPLSSNAFAVRPYLLSSFTDFSSVYNMIHSIGSGATEGSLFCGYLPKRIIPPFFKFSMLNSFFISCLLFSAAFLCSGHHNIVKYEFTYFLCFSIV